MNTLTSSLLDLFADRDGMGAIRLRENTYYRNNFELDEFLLALRELFAAAPG